MTRNAEAIAAAEQRRDKALNDLVSRVPYLSFMGIRVERCGAELTAVMPFSDKLIGNPMLPALHGGVTAAFLETTAVMELVWGAIGEDLESSGTGDAMAPPPLRMPKTIDFTVDYLRSGKPQASYARARVNRSGRRYASVHVEAWQEGRDRLFAQAAGHFLMPSRNG